ncbi:MAG: hypothetical protein RL641_646 [Candidatus Parcubacteria bacterium]|jgi:type IV pilus assembly protein PilC
MKKNINFNISIDFITSADKVLFAEELAVLLRSGMALSEAMQVIYDGTKNNKIKKIIASLQHASEEGTELSEALAMHPNFFNSFFVNMVKIGEESGTLVKNLGYISDTLKKEKEFKGKVKGALMYPMVILGLAVVVGFGIAIFVLPKLTELFSSLDVKLPLSTRVLIWVADNAQVYGIPVFLGLVGIGFLFKMALLKPKVRYFFERVLFMIPAISSFMRNYQLASFSRNMSVMLKSGLPIGRAFEVVYGATTSEVFKRYIIIMQNGVTKGMSLEESVEQIPEKKFPPMTKRMIGVGERSGSLSDSFSYLADYYEEATDNFTKNLGTIIEPFILVLVGLVVGFIAMAIITPIYNFTGQVQ